MKLRTGTKLELKLKTAVIQDSAEMILGEKYLDLKQCTRAALGRMAGDQDLVYLGEPWITTQLLRSHSCPAPLSPPPPPFSFQTQFLGLGMQLLKIPGQKLPGEPKSCLGGANVLFSLEK